jgi:hypothetical protein
MGQATIEETFSRYGHLMPGTRNQARELVDAYMERCRGIGAETPPRASIGSVDADPGCLLPRSRWL